MPRVSLGQYTIRKAGFTLIETLVASVVLALAVYAAFQTIYISMKGIIWLRSNDRLYYGAEYWFNCLEKLIDNTSLSNLTALENIVTTEMPTSYDGGAYFDCTQVRHSGANPPCTLEVTLTVSTVPGGSNNMQMTRKFKLLK